MVHDFPLDFWHPFYFGHATISMGIMVGFMMGTMTVGNMAHAWLLIDCLYLTPIPHSIMVFHNGRQIVCPVTTDGLYHLEDHQPPPQHDGGDPRRNSHPGHDSGDPNQPYDSPDQQPMRRHIRLLLVPPIDPNRQPASTTSVLGQTGGLGYHATSPPVEIVRICETTVWINQVPMLYTELRVLCFSLKRNVVTKDQYRTAMCSTPLLTVKVGDHLVLQGDWITAGYTFIDGVLEREQKRLNSYGNFYQGPIQARDLCKKTKPKSLPSVNKKA